LAFLIQRANRSREPSDFPFGVPGQVVVAERTWIATDDEVVAEGRTFPVSKALMGFVGQPPAYLILRELNALKARVAELERALAVAEQEIALRDVEELRSSTKKEAALA
jgi:hypothetical protein